MSEPAVNGYQDHSNDFEEVEIPVPWGHITGKWWGRRNVQPVIGIHGWQDNSGTFDNLAPFLIKKDISFYCIDLPGHGFSSPLPKGLQYYLWWDGVHFLRRIVKHFDWKNIKLIGHSLGGGISFLYASTYPKEVSQYVCIDIVTPSVRNFSKMVAGSGSSIDKFLEYETLTVDKMPCYEYKEMVDIMLQAHNGSVDRPGCETLLKRGMRPATHKEGCHLFTRDPRLKVAGLGFFSLDMVLEFASRIECEVLNITAEKSLRHEHPKSYDAALEALERSAKRLVVHKVDGTHHVHLTNAPAVAPVIVNFLLN